MGYLYLEWQQLDLNICTKLLHTILLEQNEDITARFMNEDDFKKLVSQHLLKQVYEQIHGQQAPEV